MTIFNTILTMFTFFASIRSSPINNCPSVQLQTNPPVNISEYMRKSWYIQQQQVNGYQSENDLFCVVATYNIDKNSKVPFFSGQVLSVYNYANTGKVNGVPTGYFLNNTNAILCARERDNNNPEKLSVAPCFLPNVLSGPYWIVYAGPTTDNYKWAIVSGGQPSVRVDNYTCTTKESGVNNSGLWIFSREQVISNDELMYLRNILLAKNISTEKLLNVPQNNCNYSKAYIK